VSWVRVQGGVVGSGAAVTSFNTSITVTLGNVLCIGVGVNSASSTISVGDGHNTYTSQTSVVGTFQGAIYTAPITTGGALTPTVTFNGSHFGAFTWAEYSYTGASLTIPDGTASNTGTGTSLTTGSLSLTTPDLVYAIAYPSGASSVTAAGGGLTLRSNQTDNPGVNIGFADADMLNQTSSPVNGTFTASSGTAWVSAAIGLLAAGGSSVLPAGTGAFAETGEPLSFGIALNAGTGAFAETGEPLSFGIALNESPGSVAFTGQPITFSASSSGNYGPLQSGIVNSRRIVA
jgi:hypothetical protein